MRRALPAPPPKNHAKGQRLQARGPRQRPLAHLTPVPTPDRTEALRDHALLAGWKCIVCSMRQLRHLAMGTLATAMVVMVVVGCSSPTATPNYESRCQDKGWADDIPGKE